MKVIQWIYTIWFLIILITVFILCLPFFYLFLLSPKVYKGVHVMNKIWSYLTLNLCFLQTEKVYEFDLKTLKSPVIYCGNHTSYLDIAMVFRVVPGFFSIIGKAELNKVPFFGRMFRNVYISVDRRNGHSRKESLEMCRKVIDKGRSMVFYPEGRIPREGTPKMSPFKDGAFLLAIEKQIPIVPITFPYNWIILPENLNTLLTPHKAKVVFHKPISTLGMTKDDVGRLKSQTYEVMNNELAKHFDI